MIDRGQRPSLALEARHAISVSREALRQDFDRHVASELRIRHTPHFAHPGFAELAGDAIVGNALLRSHLFNPACQFSTTVICADTASSSLRLAARNRLPSAPTS